MLTRSRGFSLIELLVAVTLMTILLSLAMPAFTGWIRNAKVRSVAESLQNGVRLAQTEAVRRFRPMVFFLTDQKTCTGATTAADAGAFWAIRTIPLAAGEVSEAVKCGVLADVAGGVQLAGPTAICFNANGRQAAIAAPGVGGPACTLAAAGINRYGITNPNVDAKVDHPLQVQVTLGGSVRLCDPARSYSATTPDGC
ncbi:Tfp pilus assembly protein FimT/FimU [Roseateles sp.]|uniref:pilus assembly FimT family protein n=1 Tax=Roseateles sp. TaxID=1971397 RepID=UPI00286D49DD|nr:prepilin-type N-terminal cleavage/methylation domain-containing protein [Roseateles sp.]